MQFTKKFLNDRKRSSEHKMSDSSNQKNKNSQTRTSPLAHNGKTMNLAYQPQKVSLTGSARNSPVNLVKNFNSKSPALTSRSPSLIQKEKETASLQHSNEQHFEQTRKESPDRSDNSNEDEHNEFERDSPPTHFLRKSLSREQFQELSNPSFIRTLQLLSKTQEQIKNEALQYAGRAKREIKNLLFVLIFWGCCAYAMSCMGVVASMRAPNHMVLPDIGFDIIDIVPRWPNGPAWLPSIFTYGMPNYWMTVITVITLIRVLIHPLRFMIMRRFFIVHSALMLLRSFFIVATSLPDPFGPCKDFVPTGSIWSEGLKRLLSGGFAYCDDVFFSGHVAQVTLCGMIWEQYQSNWYFKVTMWFMVCMEGAFLLGTKMHYTIDILIGSYLAYRLWRYYHSMNPFFVWLESNPAIVALKAEESEERDDTLLRWIQRAPPFSDISKEYEKERQKRTKIVEKRKKHHQQ